MLFGYPIAATEENWIHESLCALVQRAHQYIDADQELPLWSELLPAESQDKLASRHGLETRFLSYAKAAAALASNERALVIAALHAQNMVAELLSCTADCVSVHELPAGVRRPIRDLFEFGYRLLSDFRVRDRQYDVVYQAIKSKVCPFCGCEYFDSPQAPREALDHYLAASLYPFAAANLRNLVPMGSKCNSRYKLAADILRRDDGTRRMVFDPYAAPGLSVSLTSSAIGEGASPLISQWNIDFDYAGAEIEAWDQVFDIRTRYRRDVLEPNLNNWLREFRSWRAAVGVPTNDDNAMQALIQRYVDYHAAQGFNDRAFMKASVFRMLLAQCANGNDRVLALMRDLVAVA